jgi:serine/threonine-protein kinase
MRVLFAHLQESPPDISELRRDISPAVAKAISRALEKEAADRPSTASGYMHAIARAGGL